MTYFIIQKTPNKKKWVFFDLVLIKVCINGKSSHLALQEPECVC